MPGQARTAAQVRPPSGRLDVVGTQPQHPHQDPFGPEAAGAGNAAYFFFGCVRANGLGMSLSAEERRLRTTPINAPATNRPVTTANSNITVYILLSDHWFENCWSYLNNRIGAGNSFAALQRLHQEFRVAAVPGGADCPPLAARGAGRKKEALE